MNSVCHQSDPAYLTPTTTIALKLYNCGTISLKEEALAHRALAGFRTCTSSCSGRPAPTRCWKVMGDTCFSLAFLDIWRSSQATVRGVSSLLRLDLASPTGPLRLPASHGHH